MRWYWFSHKIVVDGDALYSCTPAAPSLSSCVLTPQKSKSTVPTKVPGPGPRQLCRHHPQLCRLAQQDPPAAVAAAVPLLHQSNSSTATPPGRHRRAASVSCVAPAPAHTRRADVDQHGGGAPYYPCELSNVASEPGLPTQQCHPSCPLIHRHHYHRLLSLAAIAK